MVHTLEEAQKILEGEESVALDLETTGFSPWVDNIAVITLFGQRSKTPVILHYPRGRQVPQKVMRWLETFPELTTHNGAMFDILFMANNGMKWENVKWYDTLTGELAVITSSRRNVRVNLEASLKRRTGKTINKDINHESWGADTLDTDQLSYLRGDISHLLTMRDEQFSRAVENRDMLRNLDFEMELVPAVVQMELNGLPISLPKLAAYLKENEDITKTLAPKIYEMLGGEILLSSPIQLRKRLNSIFGEDMFASTAAEVLQEWVIFGGQIGETCATLLEYKHAETRQKLYSPKVDKQGRTKKSGFRDSIVNHDGFQDTRLHGKFWQIGTDTGRFSSSQPNLQQIPRDMRAVFEARPGWMIGATDYTGIEVRVAASLSDDREMIRIFTEGGDIHREVAAAGFDISLDEVTDAQRQIAKAMSFTLLFGGGAETFRAYATARGSSITLEMAELAVERFFERFEGIAQMRQSAIWKAQNMKAVTLMYPTGLKRVLFQDTLRSSVILNNIVQGTAAAGLKYGLLECWKDGLAKYISAVVHDEIVYVAPEAEIIQVRDGIEDCMIRGMLRAMEGSTPVPVAVESEYGRSWAGDKSTTHVRVGG